jgi:hypothetical protein
VFRRDLSGHPLFSPFGHSLLPLIDLDTGKLAVEQFLFNLPLGGCEWIVKTKLFQKRFEKRVCSQTFAFCEPGQCKIENNCELLYFWIDMKNIIQPYSMNGPTLSDYYLEHPKSKRRTE